MYESRVTREHRTAIILLCDRSGSMSEEVLFREGRVSKAAAVSTIINEFVDELINRSRREDGVRDYFDIAVIEYSGDGVVSLLSGAGEFATAPELVRKPVGVERRTILRRLPGGNQVAAVVAQKLWVEPKAVGNTPMGAALTQAEKMVRKWCAREQNRASFPPIVVNITDGEASDADPDELLSVCEKIRSASTVDGATLLFNIHLSRTPGECAEIRFPSGMEHIPGHRYARLLYDMSSEMPSCYNEAILASGPAGNPPFRAMSYNCAAEELFNMLSIGSLSVSLIS